MGRTGAIVIAVHILVFALLFWKSAELLAGSGDGPGPRGGGGGGGRQALHMFLLSGVTAPQAVAVPQAPQVTTHLALPVPAKLDLPKLQPAPQPVETQVAVAPGTGNGTTGGPGEGPGSGGGKGAGVGPGVGNDSGPGSGGNGTDPLMPVVQLWPMPPACLPRGRYTIHFWITETGSISKVVTEPRVKNSDCQHEFEQRSRDYKFLPARNRSGIPVAIQYDAVVSK